MNAFSKAARLFLAGTGARRPGLALAAALGLLSGAQPAMADLSVNLLIADLVQPNQMRQDILLSNGGDATIYVEVGVEELVPVSDTEREPRQGSPDELGLLVTPNRLILEPGQRRPVRAVVLQRDADRERVYRITSKPAVGDIIPDQAPAKGQTSLTLNVTVAYQTILYVRPLSIREDLAAARQGDLLTFENRGNVSMLLDSGQQCPAAAGDPAACEELPAKRVYPGKGWTVPVQEDAVARYTIKGPTSQVSKEF